MKKSKFRLIILGITAIFIFFYWASVLTGIFPVTDTVPGFKNWFVSFLLPDTTLGIISTIAFIGYLQMKQSAPLFTIVTGSMLIFLGLYALAYGHNTGILYILTVDEIIEIGIKIYCITVGPYLIYSGWKSIKSMSR